MSNQKKTDKMTSAEHGEQTHPAFGTALRFWLKLGFISFGGPTGQIAIMHEELVEKRHWISEERFLHALNFCMLLQPSFPRHPVRPPALSTAFTGKAIS